MCSGICASGALGLPASSRSDRGVVWRDPREGGSGLYGIERIAGKEYRHRVVERGDTYRFESLENLLSFLLLRHHLVPCDGSGCREMPSSSSHAAANDDVLVSKG